MAESYGLENIEAEPVKGGAANSSYRIRGREGMALVLTVLDNHNWESAVKLVALTDWLLEHSVCTPEVLTQVDGARVGVVRDHPYIARPLIEGKQPSRLNVDQAEAIGRALGQLHSLEPPSGLGLPGRRLPDDWRAEIEPQAPPELLDLLDRAAESLEVIQAAPLRLIHGDLFPDNMIWGADGQLHILDWETASVDWAPLDLGFTAVGLSNDGPLPAELADGLITGYSAYGMSPTRDEFMLTARYACAVLAFHRFRRHVIRYPDPDRFDYWRELVPFMRSVEDQA